jgi:hypothetical protein
MLRSWREIAKIAINETIDNTSPHPIGDYRLRVKKAVDAAYPFGQRRCHPYKMWLEESAVAFYRRGIIDKPPKKQLSKAKSPPQQDSLSPGQLSLLEFVPPIPAAPNYGCIVAIADLTD